MYTRLNIPQVQIGNVVIAANNPVALQSMTNTDTNDIEKSIEQCIRIFDAGADYVRLTAQGIKEAESLAEIKAGLKQRGYDKPLVADIHFNPKAAIVAAKHVEKVRINPGNYVSIGSRTKIEYSEEEYNDEIRKIKENILPLLEACKEHGTAIRIGVNHGSLSQRIVGKYGDTPMGMVMSMMEFLKICKEANFTNIVCSIKASNTRVMVYATRLLAQIMKEEDSLFPIHLGVTEAGAGEDGRIKSAVGIGSLLLDGIGDTIRVSLTEAPELEIPVCKQIVSYTSEVLKTASMEQKRLEYKLPITYNPTETIAIKNIGGQNVPIVFGVNNTNKADWCINEEAGFMISKEGDSMPLVTIKDILACKKSLQYALVIQENEIGQIDWSEIGDNFVIILKYKGLHIPSLVRMISIKMIEFNIRNPFLLWIDYDACEFSDLQIKSAIDFGAVLIDGFCQGICITRERVSNDVLEDLSFSILQASRSRFSKTEFISCPSCGRTLFNIEFALSAVKKQTSHLKGLKIAVMGCVVNGPGEMADADYGYVGGGRGTVNLYRKQNLVVSGIEEGKAVAKLIDIIKENGDWQDLQ